MTNIEKTTHGFSPVVRESQKIKITIRLQSVQFPNGAMKPISGIGVGSDGQVGVEGEVHSEAVKNTVGQTLTRFVGAYAEGSMQRGALGGDCFCGSR